MRGQIDIPVFGGTKCISTLKIVKNETYIWHLGLYMVGV
jgi:hypothetical protein